jgi:hypothetical protein
MSVTTLEFSTSLIFDKLYSVRYRLLEATSVDDIKLFGTPVSDHEGFDKNHYNRYITAGLSIMRMAEMNADGVPLRIPNHDDVIEIYRSISLHISNWKEMMRRSLNIKKSTLDDLRKLDRLSVAIYEHAKYQLIEDDAFNSFASQHMDKVISVTADTFFTSRVPEKKDFVERTALGDTNNDMELIFKRPKY